MQATRVCAAKACGRQGSVGRWGHLCRPMVWCFRVDKGSPSSAEPGGGRASAPPEEALTGSKRVRHGLGCGQSPVEVAWKGKGNRAVTASGLSQHQRGGTQEALTSHKGNSLSCLQLWGRQRKPQEQVSSQERREGRKLPCAKRSVSS